jgi:hypothetical protein
LEKAHIAASRVSRYAVRIEYCGGLIY